ncbi:MAG: glycosyltransferase family 1 protein [Bacteroidota bacterium]|nr:glycosyltransferase family 1 protein [Bacteroidota bacterium]
MNTLFLISESLSDFSGISKKILAQVNALKFHGLKVDISYLEAKENNQFTGRSVNGKIIDRYSSVRIISKLHRRCKYKNLYNYIESKEIKLVYIRYTHFANPFFISFLKKLKKKGIIILLEIPTFPYDQEYKNAPFSSKIVFLLEKYFRNGFKNYITRIITLSPDTTIFKTPTIEISNGIDANLINLVQKHKQDGEFNLIGVATIGFWHGYDRVIKGLHNYYSDGNLSKKKVFFHVVGDTSNTESQRYKELVDKYHLNTYINFYGRKSGKELDTIFNRMDLAVGSIACHRISLKYIKSLKNREYCARGIPFFYSEIDPDFENKNFVFKVPANDEPVDIQEIVNFISNNHFDAVEIRNYAVENLTWEKQFEKVLREIALHNDILGT